ncbi:hypothetical protein WISP_93375 [Willisornis vidua]|uniref:Uncharacterized protein n=1 Tax=Willisornis vidua TaxID=1566151 RepID=A0ABQ9D6T5_9PASS|nr:hypothetical protein WISP_93375 [Willisornis vidua]
MRRLLKAEALLKKAQKFLETQTQTDDSVKKERHSDASDELYQLLRQKFSSLDVVICTQSLTPHRPDPTSRNLRFIRIQLISEMKTLQRIVVGAQIPDVLNYSNPHPEVAGSLK